MDAYTIVGIIIVAFAALYFYAFAKYFGHASMQDAQKINDIQFGKTDTNYLIPPTSDEAPPNEIIVDPKTLSRPDTITWGEK